MATCQRYINTEPNFLPGPRMNSPFKTHVVAIAEFPKSEPNELAMVEGDLIKLIPVNQTAESFGGWGFGSLNGRKGYFPLSFVQPLPERLTPSNAPPTPPYKTYDSLKIHQNHSSSSTCRINEYSHNYANGSEGSFYVPPEQSSVFQEKEVVMGPVTLTIPQIQEWPSTAETGDNNGSQSPNWNGSKILDDRPEVPPKPKRTSKPSPQLQYPDRREESRSKKALLSPTQPMHRECEDCEKIVLDASWCNVCRNTLCGECWPKQVVHKKKTLGTGNVPHEKTDPLIAMQIEAILDPITSETEHRRLHLEDSSTKWFGLLGDRLGRTVFHDFGRYSELMASNDCDDPASQYPSLVSFVGQTGAGKSTLIKALVKLNSGKDDYFTATPVVGHISQSEIPTSGEVHLYSDPTTYNERRPLLYADCEGLDGGNRDPAAVLAINSAEYYNHSGAHRSSYKLHERDSRPKGQRISRAQREVVWANTKERKSREFAVEHIYPRFLYTFSDVVCFVTKNLKSIETVVEKLILWARNALEKSLNQPLLPIAIIVLNADNRGLEEWWDVGKATALVLQSIDSTIHQNPKFDELVQYWKGRGKNIKCIKDLLCSYYTGVKVVCIPYKGRPNLINQQYRKLYSEIKSASEIARKRRNAAHMLLNAEELEPYLQHAFDHFSNKLDGAFDFVGAAFLNNPVPKDFSDHILRLAACIMKQSSYTSGAMIFTRIAPLIASCIMLEASRRKIPGTWEQIFPRYKKYCRDAQEQFYTRHWVCEFRHRKTGAHCVNIQSGHSKGHQQADGKVLAAGSYKCSFQLDEQDKFLSDVSTHLKYLLDKISDRRESEAYAKEELLASEIHQFYTLSMYTDIWGPPIPLISHTTCFSCLFEPPLHALPCGHVLCELCIRSFAKDLTSDFLTLKFCPLCNHEDRPWNQAWRVKTKPPTAGVRILTLDGGGIKGIIELEMLSILERTIGLGVPIQEFFDLIIGTSCGGIIALGLGVKNWTVEACKKKFKELSKQAFTKRVGSDIPIYGLLVKSHHHSAYETTGLEESLKGAFSSDEALFGGKRAFQSSEVCKVGVTTVSTSGLPYLLSNYNRQIQTPPHNYCFQRAEHPDHEFRTWEAARATSAAPTYFKPFSHPATKHTFEDGGLKFNNPIRVADNERKLIWPELAENHPDMILSLGTGFNPNAKHAKTDQEIPQNRTGITQHVKRLLKIGMDAVEDSLDCQATWKNYIDILEPFVKNNEQDKERYRRLNLVLEISEFPPKLDDVKAIDCLEGLTRDYFSTDPKIPDIAAQLIATLFYFVLETAQKNETRWDCSGTIFCRLPGGLDSRADPLRRLTERISHYSHSPPGSITSSLPVFFLRESPSMNTHLAFSCSAETIKNIRGEFAQKIWFSVYDENDPTMISFALGPRMHPISGFPRAVIKSDFQRHASFRRGGITRPTSSIFSGSSSTTSTAAASSDESEASSIRRLKSVQQLRRRM